MPFSTSRLGCQPLPFRRQMPVQPKNNLQGTIVPETCLEPSCAKSPYNSCCFAFGCRRAFGQPALDKFCATARMDTWGSIRPSKNPIAGRRSRMSKGLSMPGSPSGWGAPATVWTFPSLKLRNIRSTALSSGMRAAINRCCLSSCTSRLRLLHTRHLTFIPAPCGKAPPIPIFFTSGPSSCGFDPRLPSEVLPPETLQVCCAILWRVRA